MNIALYLVDREGVDQPVMQAQIEHAMSFLIRRGLSVAQLMIYAEPDASVPAALRPRLTVMTEDAARGGFKRILVSALRDFSADAKEQTEVVAKLARLGVRVEVTGVLIAPARRH